MIGPLTVTAVFVPANKHQETLLRYDLGFTHSCTYRLQEHISDIARYNRILALNRSELGYLVRCLEPEESSNLFQSEASTDLLYGNFLLQTHRNFI